ncbi:hypothetical protein IC607_10265 [Cellulomonas sp. JH27-2]|uniref:hypothetical protein n=1 Tax=Cellulomonas sp. JH27-2 TaxID=2774139 RepID=UPI00177B9B91|nr:hypothetical protein [Cellulomonas sp. JH27-2]MBD8059350.1 hypothetical protein [Cellulomonas sp. JH27-2]
MSTAPTWTPAETDEGGRAFATTIGGVDVLVTFAGDSTGRLNGAWEVRSADDDALLEGRDEDLAGSRSAVGLYASLVSIADQLTDLLAPPPPSTEVRLEYKLLKLDAADDDATFARQVEALLAQYAAAGWRLVSVDDRWAYLERPAR